MDLKKISKAYLHITLGNKKFLVSIYIVLFTISTKYELYERDENGVV